MNQNIDSINRVFLFILCTNLSTLNKQLFNVVCVTFVSIYRHIITLTITAKCVCDVQVFV